MGRFSPQVRDRVEIWHRFTLRSNRAVKAVVGELQHGPRTIPDGSAVAHADKWLETKCLSSRGDARVTPRQPTAS
jgi:hypothetical protein